MIRTAVLLCAVMLIQAMAVRALPQLPVCRSVCPDDGADDGCSAARDEALAGERDVLVQPPSSRPRRWDGPPLSVALSPAPDEIPHVPKPLVV